MVDRVRSQISQKEEEIFGIVSPWPTRISNGIILSRSRVILYYGFTLSNVPARLDPAQLSLPTTVPTSLDDSAPCPPVLLIMVSLLLADGFLFHI